MNYEEFSELEEIFDCKFIKGFRFPSGEKFYIEPAFYTQLMYLNQILPNEFPKVIKEMKRQALDKKLVSFVYDKVITGLTHRKIIKIIISVNNTINKKFFLFSLASRSCLISFFSSLIDVFFIFTPIYYIFII